MRKKFCEMCGRTLPVTAFSEPYQLKCKECESKAENGGFQLAVDIHANVDWEQRRYEIAKDMLCALYTDEGFDAREKNDAMFEYQDLDSCAKEAVRYADALIRELKK